MIGKIHGIFLDREKLVFSTGGKCTVCVKKFGLFPPVYMSKNLPRKSGNLFWKSKGIVLSWK